MKTWFDLQLRRDVIKLLCLAGAIAGTFAVFVVTPALSTPTLLSVVITMLLSPWVAALERRGHSRALAIAIIFAGLGLIFFLTGFWAIQSIHNEWDSFKETAPANFQSAMTKLTELELRLKTKYQFLQTIHPTDSMFKWGRDTGKWFVEHGASMMGEFLTWIFIVPPLSFVLLNEGRTIRKRFYHLVPNRYFESVFLMSTQITTAISDYLRAKLVEAFLVGLITTAGLAVVKAPYAIVLGVAAGVTNIIPYLGPVLGAVRGLLIAGFDTLHPSMWLPVTLVYVFANVVDTFVIFPVVVAKLVKLHPLILIAVVMVGQQYYGLVGMLISIPIATALKVVLQELYFAVYEHRLDRNTHATALGSGPLLKGN